MIQWNSDNTETILVGITGQGQSHDLVHVSALLNNCSLQYAAVEQRKIK